MKHEYLLFRTFVVLAVVAVFAFATHPLTPRDFFQTFRETVAEGQSSAAELLIEKASAIQQNQSEQYPSVALYDAAETDDVDLRPIVAMPGAADNSEVVAFLRKKAAGSIRLGLDLAGGVEFVLNLQPDYDSLAAGGVSRKEAEARLEENFNQYRDIAMESLRKRLEERNIFESELTPFGKRGLSLKAPIVSRDEKDQLNKLIRAGSKLQFKLVHPNSQSIIESGRIPAGYELMTEEAAKGKTAASAVVSHRTEMNGSGIQKAFVSRDQFGRISIALEFNSEGAAKFAAVTRENVGRQLAIVLDGRLCCAPVIKGEIAGGRAEISGSFSLEDAKNVADALTNGSFPFKIDVEAMYDTAPTLGADNVRNGIVAGIIAISLLAAFMIAYYHKCGIIACTALAVNVVLILGAMAAFGATMTMPGIAGIILTLGMAVDANVLVFERMREELELKKPAAEVVRLGFSKALSSVMDGNLTTLVVAVILMYFGTGAVKGFASSLSIGIIASLFTALFMTRVIFDWYLHFSPNPHFTMMKFFSRPNINFIRQSRIAVPLSLAAILISIGAFMWRGHDMLAVDFTGGTLLSCSYHSRDIPTEAVENALSAAGLAAKATYKSNASQADNRKLELLFGDSGSESGKQLADRSIATLNAAFPELKLSDAQLTSVGSMVGGEMTRNAIYSILLAFAGMIVYVSFRYEFSYAAAGIMALVHDVVIALGIFTLMGRELSLPVVAGLLTIIGYSINDTIVIFDRIREELKLNPGMKFSEAVNLSLNRTLSRTILTSLTTFLVVVTMFFFGGIAINDFVLVIMLGIVIGTYSSLYIASPIVVKWHAHKAAKHSLR
ncbi:MAG: protein translocase subunit SecD [Victivallaceae bacterium]|nr:protein translocase subunit SecD [Victivallaceae bacterium]